MTSPRNTGHSGIDISGIEGDNLFAVDGGVMVYAGWHEHGYGNLVIIDHGTGYQSVYAHLNEIYTQCGQSVDQGAVIGSLGNTGNSSGPHLHFELRYNSAASKSMGLTTAINIKFQNQITGE